MLKAKDIMTTDVITVGKDTPILEAAELLVEHNISGMPVVDEDMNIEGILSEKDAIQIFYCEKEKLAGECVSDFMTRPAIHFDLETDMIEVCDFLIKNIFRRIPISSEGKLVGIVSIKDVIESTLHPVWISFCEH
jgi:CBS domain-containing protein